MLAWLAVQAASVDALIRSSPATAGTIAPNDPRIPMARARDEFARTRGRVSQPIADAAILASQGDPLAEEPFFVAALQAIARGDDASALRLLEEARDRNPRSRLTRLVLLDRYLHSNRIEDAASEMAVLTRLIPEAATVLVPELARLANEPKSEHALTRVLRTDPEMHQLVLRHLASTGADPALVLRIAKRGASTPPAQSPIWPAILLRSLVQKGDVERAHQVWRELGGNGDQGLVYNGAFEARAAPPPFNWRLESTNGGVAEFDERPGLVVEYYGRETTTLASQLLILPPGRYQISFEAAGSASGEGSPLAWQLSCDRTRTAIAEVPLIDVTYNRRRITGAFTVPGSGCPAQWLTLIGNSAEFPKPQSVTITNMQIRTDTP